MKNYSIFNTEETKPLQQEELKELFMERDKAEVGSDTYLDIIDTIAMHNLRLVRKYAASEYSELELDDLAPMGFDALRKAAAKFDLAMNKSFSSYAKLWIITELDRKAQEEFMAIHLSKRDYTMLKTYHVKNQELTMIKERFVTFDEVVEFMNLTNKQAERLHQMLLASDIKSLDNAINDDEGSTFNELIPADEVKENDGVAMIQSLLTNTEYDMLLERGEGMSFEKIANLHNIDVKEVKCIIKEAISKVNSNAIKDALMYND